MKSNEDNLTYIWQYSKPQIEKLAIAGFFKYNSMRSIMWKVK